MSAFIEQSLRGRARPYFRGHREGEFFFIVDLLAGTGRSRMHVHLRPADGGSVTVGIVGDRFYPASERDALARLACRSDVPSLVDIVVHDSCDDELVGVLVTSTVRPAGAEELTGVVDSVVGVAAEFFRGAATLCGPDQANRRSA